MAKDSSINTLFKDKICPTPDISGNWGKNVKPLGEGDGPTEGVLGPGVQIMNVEGGEMGGTKYGLKK